MSAGSFIADHKIQLIGGGLVGLVAMVLLSRKSGGTPATAPNLLATTPADLGYISGLGQIPSPGGAGGSTIGASPTPTPTPPPTSTGAWPTDGGLPAGPSSGLTTTPQSWGGNPPIYAGSGYTSNPTPAGGGYSILQSPFPGSIPNQVQDPSGTWHPVMPDGSLGPGFIAPQDVSSNFGPGSHYTPLPPGSPAGPGTTYVWTAQLQPDGTHFVLSSVH